MEGPSITNTEDHEDALEQASPLAEETETIFTESRKDDVCDNEEDSPPEDSNLCDEPETVENNGTTNPVSGEDVSSNTQGEPMPEEALKVEMTKCDSVRNAFHVDLMDIGAEMPPLLVIVSREQWRAKPPTKPNPKPNLTTTVMFTYATHTKPCFTPEVCEKRVRKIQRCHMEGGQSDIPFNFLVGGDGRVYEGRGWHENPRTRLDYIKLKGFLIEIAFIGDYRVERPSEVMFDAALDLVHYGRSNFWIREKFGLIENYD